MLLNVYICGEKAILLHFVEIFFNKYAPFVCSTCMNVTCYSDILYGEINKTTKVRYSV